MAVHYTSDLHFGHHNIITYCQRPYRSVEEMDEDLVRRWNEHVAPDDTVWVLGDVALGRLEETLRRVGELNGTKHLVSGNHDRCWRGHKKVGSWPQRYLDAGFATVQDEANVTLAGRTVVLSHFPYEGDSHGTDRYHAHRPVDRGGWVVHGHVHGAWRVRGRQLNVGCDVWEYRPATEAELEAIVLAGPGRSS